MEVAYFVCINNECAKHRSIFIENDPDHVNCKRARLYLQKKTGVATWVWFAALAALGIAAGALAFVMSRGGEADSHRPPLGERRTETWSGTQRVNDERRGHPVPPPIV